MKPYGKGTIMILLALLLAVLLPVRAQAVDVERPVSLTIQHLCGEKAGADVDFALYRVADISASGEFALAGDFKDYPVSLENQNAEGWRALAATLAGYAQRDKLTPLAAGKTDQEGTLAFQAEALTQGLYLVLGGQYVDGNDTYTAEPFLVSLPGSGGSGEPVYDVTVEPKSTVQGGGDSTVSRKVLKVWDDQGSGDSRPGEVTVQLLRNGEVWDTVTLNQEGGWRHTWQELDASAQWTVVEQEVSGYTVAVTREGVTFVVTNTRQPDGPDDPTNPTGPTDPSNPSNPSDPSNPNHPTKPSLPNTGVLWWPVPVLLAGGLLFIVVGCLRRRKDDGA